MSSTAIPCLRYRDAYAAIDWLCQCFGFRQHLVVPNRNGGVGHAELTLDGGMIMLGSQADDEYGQLLVTPDQAGGKQTQTTCLVVADADEIYNRVVASGARIVQEIDDAPYGGRVFACRDPEGHVWHIGTYNPWAGGA